MLLPPLLAGLIVLATHVPLGKQVLARGIIFIDLAVAQLAGLGVIIIHVINEAPSSFAVQIAALLMALFGGVLFAGWSPNGYLDWKLSSVRLLCCQQRLLCCC